MDHENIYNDISSMGPHKAATCCQSLISSLPCAKIHSSVPGSTPGSRQHPLLARRARAMMQCPADSVAACSAKRMDVKLFEQQPELAAAVPPWSAAAEARAGPDAHRRPACLDATRLAKSVVLHLQNVQ